MTVNTTKEVLAEAYQRGRAWDPQFPNLQNLDLGRIAKMNGTEADAKQLVESYQRSSERFNVLVEAFHQRFEPAYDGEVGAATLALANTPRCPLPDFPPPPGASFHYDEPDLNETVRRMQAATGKGSWRPGCYGNPEVHEIKVSYDLSKLSSKQKGWMPAVKKHNAEAVAAMGLRLIEVQVGEFANVKFYGRNYGGSTIGMAQFNNAVCNDSVFCTVSPNYNPSDFVMFLILAMHEFGHTMNFEHSKNYIMNPFIMRVPEYWVKRDPLSGGITYKDVRYEKGAQFFGGDALDPPVLPGPAQSPEFLGEINGRLSPNGKVVIDGVIDVVVKEGQKPGTFKQIIVPGSASGKFKFAPKAEI